MSDLLMLVDDGIIDDDEEHDTTWMIYRYKVPGGWIIYRDLLVTDESEEFKQLHSTATFVADPNHEWNVDNDVMAGVI
jgi:hypothetical protein